MTDQFTPKEELVILAKELGIPFPTPLPFTLDYTRQLLYSVKQWMKRKYKAFPTARTNDLDETYVYFQAQIEEEFSSCFWGEFNSFDTAILDATITALKALRKYPEPNVPLSIKVTKTL